MPKTSSMEDTIQKLLARAEAPNTDTTEAEACIDKAAKLMMKYDIDAALLANKATVHLKPTVEDFLVANPFSLPKLSLLDGIAKSFGCRVIRTKKPSGNDGVAEVKIFGFENEIGSTTTLFLSLLLQGTSEASIQKFLGQTSKSEQTSFWYGFATRISERLASVKTDVTDSSSPGTSLVLRNRSREVDDAVNKAYPRLGKTVSRVTSSSGYQAGQAAADRANIHDKAATTSRNTRSLT